MLQSDGVNDGKTSAKQEESTSTFLRPAVKTNSFIREDVILGFDGLGGQLWDLSVAGMIWERPLTRNYFLCFFLLRNKNLNSLEQVLSGEIK